MARAASLAPLRKDARQQWEVAASAVVLRRPGEKQAFVESRLARLLPSLSVRITHLFTPRSVRVQCRILAELRHVPSMALIPLSYGFDDMRIVRPRGHRRGSTCSRPAVSFGRADQRSLATGGRRLGRGGNLMRKISGRRGYPSWKSISCAASLRRGSSSGVSIGETTAGA